MQFAQVGAVVGVQRDGERAAAAVAEVAAGEVGELGGEIRIAAGRLQVQAEQGLLAVVQFRDGGQHPGRHPGRPATRFGVHDGCGEPALRGPPRGDQADDAAPDDQDVRGVRGAHRTSEVADGTSEVSDGSGVRDMGVQPLPSPA
ncbi:hypothetical protein SALBM311S_07743 [Streptomyces alboniger]